MSFLQILKKAYTNKVLVYILTRYFTYGLQFLTSLLLARKLGPENYGVWGFMLLLISYFAIFNFGLNNSINVLMVQYKDNNKIQEEYIKNDFLLLSILGLLVILIAFVYLVSGSQWFSHYPIKYEFVVISMIAIMAYFNMNLLTINRVKNDFYRIAFNQSIIPFFVFSCAITFNGRNLLFSLLASYLIGNILSIIVYLWKPEFKISGSFSISKCKTLISKGFWLFLYNIFFYLILISTRTIISKFFSVEEFGYFTFSFTLGDSVLLLLQAFANIAFPKVLSKLRKGEEKIGDSINKINSAYVIPAVIGVLIILILFPYLLLLFPKYNGCLTCMSLVSVTMAISVHSFSYTSFLMSNNKEILLSIISFLCLLTNIVLALIFVKVFTLAYDYIILATMCAYSLFNILCALVVISMTKDKSIKIINIESYIPLLLAAILVIINKEQYILFVLILFILLNIRSIKQFYYMAIALWHNYKIINL